MSEEASRAVTIENGSIYFFVRPKIGETQPEGPEDIQRFYIVLSPDGRQIYRLAVIGQKELPAPEHYSHSRYWGFIEKVSPKPEPIKEELSEHRYETKTRGERHLPTSRPVGEGVYRIVRHADHTHLAFALELPDEPGEVQRDLQIEPEASYILSVKNPEASATAKAGLPPERRADYPSDLQGRFGNRRFAPVDPPELLDYPGAEFILIAASDNVEEDLGIRMRPQEENSATADVFRDLRLDKSKRPLQPLFKGEWA